LNQLRKEGFVHVPALPGCHIQEETLDEACKIAKDAISGYIKTL
jgi:predicted RNase H-like HicB family nuclease